MLGKSQKESFMGSWGYGIFDSDSASDFLGDIIEEYREGIESSLEEIDSENEYDEQNEEVLVLVKLIHIICKKSGSAYPEQIEIEEWHNKFMMLFNKYSSGTWLTSEDLDARKKVIEETFSSLILDSSEFWSEGE